MSPLNVLNINMKKRSVDYIRKINAVSSVEFGGMKNRAKLEFFLFTALFPAVWVLRKKLSFT